jgi:hypothetical protein
MTLASVHELMAVESRLNRSMAVCVVAILAILFWTLLMIKTGMEGATAGLVLIGLFLLQLAGYVWFAVAAGAAARRLGEAPWKYVTWILVAPFLALVPIPIVSTIIAVSPLSIKFLLGRQLQTAIRERAFAD